jgi:hemoglobin-like flavoprotein
VSPGPAVGKGGPVRFGAFRRFPDQTPRLADAMSDHAPLPSTEPDTDPNAGLKRSFASAMQDPDRFGREFYARLFALAPAVRSLFPADLTHQRDKLVRALAMLVRGVEAPESLVEPLQQLGARHVAYGVHAPHYVVVGEALIDTLDLLSTPRMDAATRTAWTRLYGWVAATMLSGAELHGARPATATVTATATITSPAPAH